MPKKQHFGKYGGRVLRKFFSGGKPWLMGAVLTPEDVKEWPLANCKALYSADKVEWFDAPDEDAQEIAAGVDASAPSDSDEEEGTDIDDVKDADDSDEDSDDSGAEEETQPVPSKSSRKRAPAKKSKGKGKKQT